MFKYHVFALLIGAILDFFVGKLPNIYNPLTAIKRWIKYLDRALLGDEIILLEPEKQKSMGIWLLILAMLPAFVVVLFFDIFCWEIGIIVGIIFEIIMSYYCISFYQVYYGALDVLDYYFDSGMDGANIAYSTFVDCNSNHKDIYTLLDDTIFTVSKRANDYIIGPLLVLFLFGPVGGILYRVIDLVDEQVGYHTKRYEYFGYYPSRTNSILNYIPSRFSGRLAVITSGLVFGDYNSKNARYIYRRDSYTDANISGLKTPAAFAGALDISLNSGAVGDADKTVEFNDVRRAVSLMRNMFIICMLVLFILLIW